VPGCPIRSASWNRIQEFLPERNSLQLRGFILRGQYFGYVLTPISCDALLSLFRGHCPGANLVVQPILNLIFRIRAVFAGMCLGPEILRVGPIAPDLQRDEVIFFVALWTGVFISIFIDLLDL
jgi:hypothetical protein